jgi:hypothetical protein
MTGNFSRTPLEVLEKFAVSLETYGRDLGVLAGERPGLYAYPKENRNGFLFDLGEAPGNVDGRPLDVNGIGGPLPRVPRMAY